MQNTKDVMETTAAGRHRRALWLSYFTVLYNILEGLLSLIAGALAGSIALIGFGLDSFIESLSGGVMIWRFSMHGRVSPAEEERIEQTAVKLVGATFFILGTYVLWESVEKLYFMEEPDPSFFGVIIALISLIVMPMLYLMKNRTGKSINSRSLIADSKQTLACMFMSAALLAGLGGNYLFGWWWADPVAGLIIVGFLFREGYEAFIEKKLCSC